MKKYTSLLMATGLLALASCNTEAPSNDNSQAIIDSMVNERVEQIRLDLEMRNDSIINELAMWRADSILNARKGRKVKRKPVNRHKIVGTATTQTNTGEMNSKPAKPATVGNGKPKMGNQNSGTVGNGKPKMGNQNSGSVGNGKPKMGNNK